ncbi:menaquinone biosynthesis protein [Paenibacillus sp.]|uniref:menaquinone biosynthesis protein n=1 Tax=Paenibacillus sp. TaxID=58172 RepID=UPI002D33642D|nr:menaquinone biosynthesis protein [Paenibacillus sp.]HZG57464.1 menaquinone biosynthesis protein [Paenibacillus sp.]
MTKPSNETERMREIRLGKIVFTNVWPVFYRFPPPALEGRIRVTTQTPTELNAALSRGDVDVASVSSFAYALHADKLLLLPDLSVSAKGAVGSLFLFAKRPLAEALPGRIALATTSATTVHLLKIIMAKRFEFTPEYVDLAPNLDTMMDTCDAALLIGDDAIRARALAEARGLHTYDLCTLWTEWTGLGMTFAVWAVRESWAEARPEDASTVHQALLAAKREGTRLPEDLLKDAVRKVGGDTTFWRNYFSALIYDFGASERQGLELYLRFAAELGFLPAAPPLRLWRSHYDAGE